MAQITLTSEESKEIFYNALCGGLAFLPGYGLSLDFDDDEYRQARAALLTDVYFEDVLMKMLDMGFRLTIIDVEGDGEHTRSVTIADVLDRVPRAPLKDLMDMIDETDDAVTADAIIQTVFFNEIIFS